MYGGGRRSYVASTIASIDAEAHRASDLDMDRIRSLMVHEHGAELIRHIATHGLGACGLNRGL